jgi:uncharacterized membrane protein (UPF0127 family)
VLLALLAVSVVEPLAQVVSIAFGDQTVEARVVDTRAGRAAALDAYVKRTKVEPFVLCWPRDRFHHYENADRATSFDIVFITLKGDVVDVRSLKAQSRALMTSKAEAAYALFLPLGGGQKLGAKAEVTPPRTPEDLPEIKFGDKTLFVEVAATKAARERGYMHRSAISEGEGMLFLFDRDDRWPFWMKNTDVALSAAWGTADGMIVTLVREMKPNTTDRHTARSPARWGLETPRGWFERNGIKAGDTAAFSDAIKAVVVEPHR